jgi:hypothetical protein
MLAIFGCENGPVQMFGRTFDATPSLILEEEEVYLGNACHGKKDHLEKMGVYAILSCTEKDYHTDLTEVPEVYSPCCSLTSLVYPASSSSCRQSLRRY